MDVIVPHSEFHEESDEVAISLEKLFAQSMAEEEALVIQPSQDNYLHEPVHMMDECYISEAIIIKEESLVEAVVHGEELHSALPMMDDEEIILESLEMVPSAAIEISDEQREVKSILYVYLDDNNARAYHSLLEEPYKKSRKLSGYNVFFKETQKRYPDFDFKAISQLAANAWNNLSVIEKKRYMVEAYSTSEVSIKPLQQRVAKKEAPKYQCEDCPRKFLYHRHYLDHQKQCGTTYQCDVCQKNFKQKSACTRHRLVVHSDMRLHKCLKCNKGFRSAPDLRIHDRTHTNERPFSCPSCSYKSTTNSNLIRHIRVTHENQHRFTCQKCDLSFSQEVALKRHTLLMHVKEMKCPHCDKCFNGRQNLDAHKHTHSSSMKEFACEECNIGFTTQSNLRRHERSYH